MQVTGFVGEYEGETQIQTCGDVELISEGSEWNLPSLSIAEIQTGFYQNKVVTTKGKVVDYFDITVFNGPHAITIDDGSSGEAEIIKIDKILKGIWGKMYPMSRECYRVTEAPGKEVNTIDEVIFEEEGMDGNNGFKNFSVVNCHITSLETLYLHSAGHIRCLYENNNNELTGKWIVS